MNSIDERLERLRAKLKRECHAPTEPGLVKWRYWHRKGYWQIWLDVPPGGIMSVPRSALAIQIACAEDVPAVEEQYPKMQPPEEFDFG